MISRTKTHSIRWAHLTLLLLPACGEGASSGPNPSISGGTDAAATPMSGAGESGSGVSRGGAGGAPQSPAGGSISAAGSTSLAGTGGDVSSGGSAGTETGGGGTGGASSAGATASAGQAGMAAGGRSIAFGTRLDAPQVVSAARALARSLAKPDAAGWRAKGDQHRTYRFDAAGTDEPYRLYVPTDWDGISSLPLAMFLHGSGNDESSYLDRNGKQMIELAQQHGYLLVSPRGVSGAYGNFLRLSAPFGDEAGAAELMAAVTPASERINELSEQDVINVLELILNEYPIAARSSFLFGHSMGSGGAWYIGGKYAAYWRALAPMSGPFVQEKGYPWNDLRPLSLLVTEGTRAPSLDASQLLADWLTSNGFTSRYRAVDADHGGMVSLVLPEVFAFFDSVRGK